MGGEGVEWEGREREGEGGRTHFHPRSRRRLVDLHFFFLVLVRIAKCRIYRASAPHLQKHRLYNDVGIPVHLPKKPLQQNTTPHAQKKNQKSNIPFPTPSPSPPPPPNAAPSASPSSSANAPNWRLSLRFFVLLSPARVGERLRRLVSEREASLSESPGAGSRNCWRGVDMGCGIWVDFGGNWETEWLAGEGLGCGLLGCLVCWVGCVVNWFGLVWWFGVARYGFRCCYITQLKNYLVLQVK